MQAKETRPSTEEELSVAFDGPALAADRFFATASPSGVRLAFAEDERPDGRSHFRAAVMLSPAAAYALGQMLLGITVEAHQPAEPVPAPQRVN